MQWSCLSHWSSAVVTLIVITTHLEDALVVQLSQMSCEGRRETRRYFQIFGDIIPIGRSIYDCLSKAHMRFYAILSIQQPSRAYSGWLTYRGSLGRGKGGHQSGPCRIVVSTLHSAVRSFEGPYSTKTSNMFVFSRCGDWGSTGECDKYLSRKHSECRVSMDNLYVFGSVTAAR